MWSEKHRPRTIQAMIGNEEARAAILSWFSKWKSGNKPLLLVGPPGTGKTTSAMLAAQQFGYDMVELNASDVRSKAKINEILGPAIHNAGIVGTQMIFIDEVDGIHGRSDYGGVSALAGMLSKPPVPIVLAANSDAASKMKDIKRATIPVHFKPLSPRLLRLHLDNVLKKENARLGPGAVIKTITSSRGDIRSMLNAAQALASGFKPDIGKSDEVLALEDCINAFFQAESADEARHILAMTRTNLQDRLWAFHASICMADLAPAVRSRMLNAVSKADMLYGRIMRTQQWRLARYFDTILLNAYEPDTGIKYEKYGLPFRVTNKIRFTKPKINTINTALASATHTSKSNFASLHLPYLLKLVRKGLELDLQEEVAEALNSEAKK